MEPFVVDETHFHVEESTSDHEFFPIESQRTSEILALEIREFPDQIFVEDFPASCAEEVEGHVVGRDRVVISQLISDGHISLFVLIELKEKITFFKSQFFNLQKNDLFRWFTSNVKCLKSYHYRITFFRQSNCKMIKKVTDEWVL